MSSFFSSKITLDAFLEAYFKEVSFIQNRDLGMAFCMKLHKYVDSNSDSESTNF